MDYYKQKLIRRLKVRSSELQGELNHAETIFNEAAPLFCLEVSSYCSSNNLSNPLERDQDDKKEENQNLTDGFKSIFRKIAVQTHPDKFNQEQPDLTEKYQDAASAKKDKDVTKILSIAKELKIDTNDISYDEIKLIEDSISKTELKIHNLTNSYPWVWFFSSSKKRPTIVSEFVLNKV